MVIHKSWVQGLRDLTWYKYGSALLHCGHSDSLEVQRQRAAAIILSCRTSALSSHQLDSTANMASPAVAAAATSCITDTFSQSSSIPAEFVWPDLLQSQSDGGALTVEKQPVMQDMPTIDLSLFRRMRTNSADPTSLTSTAMDQYHDQLAALQHAARTLGFFHVVNHDVDASLVEAAHDHSGRLFRLPLERKQRAKRLPGESFGYSSSFAGRFTSRLPWKETFSAQPTPVSSVSHYFQQILGDDHQACSSTFEKYCKEMVKLGLEILEVLGLALGLQRSSLRQYFEENSSILRLNYYPSCRQPSLTLGTGPHTDPSALTILHQDEVAGLQVCHESIWYTVPPQKDAFVINIGDTLMAITNKQCKSGVHRALVNDFVGRKSIAFFLNPPFEMTLSPPEELIDEANPRAYEDFTWENFLYFTQSVHRPCVNTIDYFHDRDSKQE